VSESKEDVFHERRHPVHHPVHWPRNSPVVVLVTVTTAGRKPILAAADAVETVVGAWRESGHWLVGRYVFMPDHVHLFATPVRLDVALSAWVRYWKSLASRRWPRRDQQPVWQRDFWDRQLRSGESYRDKWEYVLNNPVRAGLVQSANDWPFAGELTTIDW
jgi:REP element-mobilizing transposase RayT